MRRADRAGILPVTEQQGIRRRATKLDKLRCKFIDEARSMLCEPIDTDHGTFIHALSDTKKQAVQGGAAC
jgi:hypothetical protein